KSREAPANLMPVGTGPYKCTEFKPGDMVAGVLNAAYHLENRPYFDSVVMKGGGDAVSAARTVLQTGEYDFAWNLQVEDEIRSRNTSFEFNVDKANELLDKAGWKKGGDGIREKDGRKLRFVFQTSINQPRQKTQAIVKQACQKAGIDIEVKAVTASVYFSSDVANPDTYTKFYCDLQMYTTTMTQPDPELFMKQFLSEEAATKANKWQGRNITRWQSKEYDDNFKAGQAELDPVKRAAIFIKANDMV